MSKFELEGEVLAEEDIERAGGESVRVLDRYEPPPLPVLRGEVRTAAIAAAGGVLAGAATVAAVRAVGAVSSRRGAARRPARRREGPNSIIASRSFLVDVHLLGR